MKCIDEDTKCLEPSYETSLDEQSLDKQLYMAGDKPNPVGEKALSSAQPIVPSELFVPSELSFASNKPALRMEASLNNSDTHASLPIDNAENGDVDAEITPQPAAPSEGVSLADLRENGCKWPMGDPLSERFLFCGQPIGRRAPYCDYHADIAYQDLPSRTQKL